MKQTNGEFVKHLPCDECGSADNKALYSHEDNTYSSFCFGCEDSQRNLNNEGDVITEENKDRKEVAIEFNNKPKLDLNTIHSLPSKGLQDRGIVSNVAKFYGLKVAMMSAGEEITHHYYPFHKDGVIVGYQQREVSTKSFIALGYGKNDIELQGQHLWPNGNGKFLTITEGFLDALAVSQIMSGKSNTNDRFPVVSLPSGANTKCIAHNLAWIDSFDKVIIMTDQDEAGQKVAKEIANMLAAGKAHIAKFSEKDACDMLAADKEKELLSAFWNAQQYSPADIVSSADAMRIIMEKKDEPCYDLPDFLPTLNTMMYGLRLGEITLLTSGTGSGKTQVARELNYDMLVGTEEKIGIVSLEESTADVFEGLLALHMNKRIHLPDRRTNITDEEVLAAGKELYDDKPNQLLVLDHQGSSADDDLLSRIRYLIASGCKFITIDHITIAISEADNTNQAIDKFMNALLKLAKKFKVHFIVVSHLRKVGQGQKNFEEGAIPTLDDMKGSGSIKQIANNVIAFARNRMDDDPVKKNTTKVYLLKCRYSGHAGYAGSFFFDDASGRLEGKFEVSEDSQTDELTQKERPVDTQSMDEFIKE